MRNSLLFSLLLMGYLLCGCEKQGRYDIFPLKTGNEFYYSYSSSRFTGISAYSRGNETWQIVSESTQGNSITYLIERTLNGISVALGDTTKIIDSRSMLQVVENKSSSAISLWGFTFKRYQDESHLELFAQGYSSGPSLTCVFKADSGMTKYYYYHPPNQIFQESYYLDSLKILP